MITLVAATGGFLFGYDLSIISGALIFLEKHFELDSTGTGFAVSSAILGSIAGPLPKTRPGLVSRRQTR